MSSEGFARIPALLARGPFDGIRVHVETSLRRGLPGMQITGMNRAAARETVERLRSAIHHCGWRLPVASLTINVAPADVPKNGAYFDLSLMACIVQALGLAPPIAVENAPLFLGEVSLSGEVLPIAGLQSILLTARKLRFRRVVVPACQTGFVYSELGLSVAGVQHVQEIAHSLRFAPASAEGQIQGYREPGRLSHLQLEPGVRRALALAAAGWHSLLLVGPPGTGKTTAGRELPGLMPVPDAEECLEIITLSGLEIPPATESSSAKLTVTRPLRSPHHSVTRAALIGGGHELRAGEVTRAHHGVLLLDELAEFRREALQALREPVETGSVDLSRGAAHNRLPARFLLVATANPCPCGYFRSSMRQCTCPPQSRQNYLSRLLGPLRDRIELEVRVETNVANHGPLATEDLLVRVDAAVRVQRERYRDERFRFNGEVPFQRLETLVPLEDPDAREVWHALASRPELTRRGLASARRLSRTLADLDASPVIRANHIVEAARFRCLDEYVQDDF